MNRKLACTGVKEIAFDADDVAQVQHFVELIVAFRHSVLADVGLQAFARWHQVHETGSTHAANGLDTTRDGYVWFGLQISCQLFRSFSGAGCQDGGNRMGKIETLAVRAVAQSLKFRNASEALGE